MARFEYFYSFTRNVKSRDSQRVHLLQALALVGALLQLLQTLRDVESQVDQDSVGLGLYLVSSEENICFEVVKSLVNDISLVGGRKTGGWTSGGRLDGQECEVTEPLLA